MLILSNTTDTIQIVLGGSVTTNQLRCYASFRDITTTAFTPGRKVVNTADTTDVNLVDSPASSTNRVIDYISIFNSDTAAQTVTVKYDANGTEYSLFVCVLGVGERIEYQEGQGFSVFANSGAVKQSLNQGTSPASSGLNVVVLSSDQTNNNAVANTIQDVTGLSFAVNAGHTYWFRFSIIYTSASTSTGSRWSINGPAITSLRYKSEYSLTTTSNTVNEGLSAYDVPAASNATSTATGSNICVIEGFITPAANGTLICRFASEVISSAIVAKAGSIVQWLQVI